MQKQEEKNELQELIKKKQSKKRPLQHSNQHLPSQQLKIQHQYQHLRLQLAKNRLQMSALAIAFCIADYTGIRYLISVLIPAGPMSSYASAFTGGFPLDFGAQIFAFIFFIFLCTTLLGKINPAIARKIKREYQRT